MRVNSLLRKLIGNPQLYVQGVFVDEGALVVRVRPVWREPRCGRCKKRPPGQRKGGASVASADRRWRHLDLAGVRLYLSYDVRWVYCRDCGRTVEQVPWSSFRESRFTDVFEEHVAYMAQRSDKTAVQRMLRVSWASVGRCVERVVSRLRPENPLEGLTAIGVDELSYRKHHHYLTFVVDHDKRRIVWGAKGNGTATLASFFEELGPEGRARLRLVSMDMSGAYKKALRENEELSHVQVVFDRFHVQQLASLALDQTRREEWNRLRQEHGRRSPEAKALKGLRWTLLRGGLTLSEAQQTRLATLQSDNKRLYRAYLLKEQLGEILDRRQPNVVRVLLEKWCSWASRSGLHSFARTAKTIREHMEGVVAYVRYRITNGLVEGLNNKARLLTRRAYGFHSAEAVLALVELCCSGLQLDSGRHALAS